jgi:hypothetical protein
VCGVPENHESKTLLFVFQSVSWAVMNSLPLDLPFIGYDKMFKIDIPFQVCGPFLQEYHSLRDLWLLLQLFLQIKSK